MDPQSPLSNRQSTLPTLDYRTILEQSQALFLFLLPNKPVYTIVGATQAYLTATMTKLDEIIGKPMFEIFPDNPAEPMATGVRNLRASLDRVVENHTCDTMAVQKYDIRVPGEQGGAFVERWWSPINCPIFGNNGELYVIVHRVEDVTEFVRPLRSQAEQEKTAQERLDRMEKMQAEIYRRAHEIQDLNEQLRQTQKELQESNRDLEHFAYFASHELQEPLRSITGFMGFLKKDYWNNLTEDARDDINEALAGANRMQELIQDLLLYSRVSRKGHAFEQVKVEDALDWALGNLQSAIGEAHANIFWESLPTVYADERQLILVLQNLIGNAVKFRGQKEPQVRIWAKRGNDEWVFAVSDNGIGIDPKQFDEIFQIFHRLHTREEYPGTGIGLALCKRIVERHGGRIWVDSSPGVGSTFFFTIPDQKPEQGETK